MCPCASQNISITTSFDLPCLYRLPRMLRCREKRWMMCWGVQTLGRTPLRQTVRTCVQEEVLHGTLGVGCGHRIGGGASTADHTRLVHCVCCCWVGANLVCAFPFLYAVNCPNCQYHKAAYMEIQIRWSGVVSGSDSTIMNSVASAARHTFVQWSTQFASSSYNPQLACVVLLHVMLCLRKC